MGYKQITTGNNRVVEFFKCHIRDTDANFSFSLLHAYFLQPIHGGREWRMEWKNGVPNGHIN